MLETVRAYALDRLEASGTQEAKDTRARHARYYLSLVEAARLDWWATVPSRWYDRLEREHDDLRAALAWALEAAVDVGLRLAAALATFWEIKGYYGEGHTWLAAALDKKTADGDPDLDRARAEALRGAGRLAYLQGDVSDAGVSLMMESVALWRQLGEMRGLAWALGTLAVAAAICGSARARSYLEESIALLRQIEDKTGLAVVLVGDGWLAEREDDYERARARLKEGIAVGQEGGSIRAQAWGTAVLGRMSFAEGDYAAAQTSFEKSLALYTQLKGPNSVAHQTANLGRIWYVEGDYARATAWLTESLRTQRRIGSKPFAASDLVDLAYVALAQGRCEEARTRLAEALALFQESRYTQDTLANDCLVACAWLAEAEGQPERAARMLGAAEAAHERRARHWPSLRMVEYERIVAAVREQLDEGTYETAWAEGRAMTAEQATAYALGD